MCLKLYTGADMRISRVDAMTSDGVAEDFYRSLVI